MLPAQEPGEMEVTDIETAAIEQTDTDLVAIEQTDAATIEQADTIALDPDPEWYVAPMMAEQSLAPQRMAKAEEQIDSILTYDVNSVLVEAAHYEYGDTIRTMIWGINPDGSRYGKSREEYALNEAGAKKYDATFHWDTESSSWKGTLKHEYVYTGGLNTSYSAYIWENNAWTEDTAYTYIYDDAGRVKQYDAFARNAQGQFVQTQKWIKDYNAAGKQTLDERYNKFENDQPIGEYKKVWEYEGNNQTLYEYYNGYSNGAWVGSSREVWQYTSGQKTYYEKQTWANGGWANSSKERWVYQKFGSQTKQTLNEKYSWSNGAWTVTARDTADYNAAGKQLLSEKYALKNGVLAGSSKEVWEYNTNNLQTLHQKYTWSNNDWTESLREIADYDASKNKILDEKYELKNGVLSPKSKTEYAFNSNNKKIYTLTYLVSNNAFAKYDSTIIAYDAAGNITESNTKYIRENDAWVGNGNRIVKSYNSAKKVIEQITMTWPTNATDWVNSQLDSTIYSGSIVTKTASYKWENDAWVGTKRTDNHYNAAGLNDTIKTYTNDGTEWIYSQRTVNTYDAAKNKILVYIAEWKENKWTLKSMEKWDLLYDANSNQILSAKWKCGADSVWQGITKDTANYSATNKQLYVAKYKGWKNNDWVPTEKLEYAYDEADRKTLQQRFVWTSGAWEGDYRDEFGYDAQGRQNLYISYLDWNNDSQSWIGSTKTETVFDSKDHPVTSVLSIWGGNTWQPLFQYQYIYDNSGREIEQTVEQYSGDTWTYADKYEHAYQGNTLVKDNAYIWLDNQWIFRTRNEVYYDGNKLRREIQGTWNNGEVISYFDNLYFYDSDYPLYTIRFENYDGTLLQSTEVKETKTPTYSGETPTRPASAEYTYTFKGWTPEIVAVTGNATYTAEYDSIKNSCLITFKNGEEVLQSTEVAYGETPSYAGEAPTKPATAQYTYTFKGWTPEIVAVAGPATYTAEFDSVVNRYRITWLDADDAEIGADSLEYGAMPSHEDVVKANTAEWTYSFAGWTPTITSVTGDATYKAQLDSVRNSYLVTFVNGADTLQSTEVTYGETPTYKGENPTKPATAQYTYTFKGWTPEIVALAGPATYTAEFDSTVNAYLISFVNGEEILQSTEVAYGETPAYAGENPTKPATAQYTYTFKGWTPEIVAVAGAATYTAEFDSTTNAYLISFVNGEEILQSTEVAYGETPEYNGENPTKPATAQYTYSFKGWTPEIVAVAGQATYTAEFDSATNAYLITFVNGEEILQSTEVAYGETPAYAGEAPTKAATAQCTYTFKGWTPEIVAVAGQATYTAEFDSTTNAYLISFVNGEEILQSTEVAYGETPAYAGENPTKPATAQYTYTFKGWTPEIVAVAGQATYTADFDSVAVTYLITFKNGEKVLQSTEVAYGEMPEYTGKTPTKFETAQYSYVFKGWNPNVVPVTGEATYTAEFDSLINAYLVIFYDEDSLTVLDSVTLEYGTMPATEVVPTKEEDAQYTYTFAGWTPEMEPITGDAVYIATYEATEKTQTGFEQTGDGKSEGGKFMRDGIIYIRRGDKIYTIDGILQE